MSERLIICRKCNQFMAPTGITFTWKPKVAIVVDDATEELKMREFECSCGIKVGFVDWKHREK